VYESRAWERRRPVSSRLVSFETCETCRDAWLDAGGPGVLRTQPANAQF